MIQLNKVWIDEELDECPDLSHIGRYSEKPSEDCIDLVAEGKWKRGMYRYFNPGRTVKETGNPDSPRQDWRRMEDYGGTWHMIGITAKAEIVVNGVTQTIRSGGRWGVESDSEPGYIASVKREELIALREICLALGVTAEDFKACERVWMWLKTLDDEN